MGFCFERDLVSCLPDLGKFARRLTGSPAQADDLVQDCVERALRHRGRFEPGTNLKAWLCTIMKNLHFTAYVRGRRMPCTELVEDAVTIGPQQEWRIMLCEVGDAIEELPPDQRRMVEMVGIDGATYEEASAALGIVMGTVRSRLSRARAGLRNALEPAESADGPSTGAPTREGDRARKPDAIRSVARPTGQTGRPAPQPRIRDRSPCHGMPLDPASRADATARRRRPVAFSSTRPDVPVGSRPYRIPDAAGGGVAAQWCHRNGRGMARLDGGAAPGTATRTGHDHGGGPRRDPIERWAGPPGTIDAVHRWRGSGDPSQPAEKRQAFLPAGRTRSLGRGAAPASGAGRRGD